MGTFFDVSDGGALRLELRSVDGRDFTLLRQIGYDSDTRAESFTVPADLRTFHTDLASVPGLFTWLVPRSGPFLPAAVLHDGLLQPQQYTGPPVDRTLADLIFREAMVGLGTGTVRAWLMWSAVTVQTMWSGPSAAKRLALIAVLSVITVLGSVATLDLFDVWNVLPWMGERSISAELVGGALFAVLVPTVLSLTWGRTWTAGAIVGIALALLLHVTLVLSVLYVAYLALERLVSRTPRGRSTRRRR